MNKNFSLFLSKTKYICSIVAVHQTILHLITLTFYQIQKCKLNVKMKLIWSGFISQDCHINISKGPFRTITTVNASCHQILTELILFNSLTWWFEFSYTYLQFVLVYGNQIDTVHLMRLKSFGIFVQVANSHPFHNIRISPLLNRLKKIQPRLN